MKTDVNSVKTMCLSPCWLLDMLHVAIHPISITLTSPPSAFYSHFKDDGITSERFSSISIGPGVFTNYFNTNDHLQFFCIAYNAGLNGLIL